MRKFLIICSLAISYCAIANAQEPKDGKTTYGTQLEVAAPNTIDNTITNENNATEEVPPVYNGESMDSLNLPAMDSRGHVLSTAAYPFYWNGWDTWDLHKGLNVSLGASVFASFGKGAYHGAGFSENMSALYAVPLTNKLSIAVGGYLNNMNWGGGNYRDAGLSAVLGYRFDDHWEAYVYGQKSLVNNYNMPRPLYDINAIGDRIGAAVRYKFNNNFSMQVSFEQDWIPNQRGHYFDQYNYPVPKP